MVIAPRVYTAAQVSAALSAAMRDGRLAAALATVGVQLASVEVLSAAPSKNKGTVAAAVGGAVGGAALGCLSLAVFFLVRSKRARARSSSGSRAPVTTHLSQEEEAVTRNKHKVCE